MKAVSTVYFESDRNRKITKTFSTVFIRPSDFRFEYQEVDTAAIYVLIHKVGKAWKVAADLMAVEGSDGSKEIKAARKKYPAAPAAIFTLNQ